MIQNKSVVGLILARGGSKGLPGKNTKPIAGKPLIAWTIEAAKNSSYIDQVALSTEDSTIIDVARNFGCDVPFVRPTQLAEDNTRAIDVVNHALTQLPSFDIIVLLQPTSPLRDHNDIDNALDLMMKMVADSCVSVSIPDHSPYWMYTENQRDRLTPLIDDKLSRTNRQSLPVVYALNGAIYAIFEERFKQTQHFVTENTVGYVMSKEKSVDIDYPLDFKIAEMLLEQKLSQQQNSFSVK